MVVKNDDLPWYKAIKHLKPIQDYLTWSLLFMVKKSTLSYISGNLNSRYLGATIDLFFFDRILRSQMCVVSPSQALNGDSICKFYLCIDPNQKATMHV